MLECTAAACSSLQRDPARSCGKGTGGCWIHPGAGSLLRELEQGGLGLHHTGSIRSRDSQVTLASLRGLFFSPLFLNKINTT